jgi:signal peptidase I
MTACLAGSHCDGIALSPQTPGLHVVKRVIGVPGDRIHLRNGIVYRNGQKLDEPYVLHDRDETFYAFRDDFPAAPPPTFDSNIWEMWRTNLPSFIKGEDIVVPPDSYFGMGDHRGISLDSRYWGFIPRENIIGRPMFIYWSFNASEEEYMGNSLGDRLGFVAHSVIHFFDETRWRRTLRVVNGVVSFGKIQLHPAPSFLAAPSPIRYSGYRNTSSARSCQDNNRTNAS